MIGTLVLAMLQATTIQATAVARPPRARNLESVVSWKDYTAASEEAGEQGIVSVLLRVSEKGRVTSCEVTDTSGHASLDARTCFLAKGRARFDPATDAAGNAVPGEYRTAFSWSIDGLKTAMNVPLRVSRVPKEYREPVMTRVVFDATGKVDSCEVVTTSGSHVADRVVCPYFKQKLAILPPRSASSAIPAAAVRDVRTALTTRLAGAR